METLDLSQRITKAKLQEFVGFMKEVSRNIGFKVSGRGWCYILEQNNMITKDQFDKVENLINKCRKEGYLPVDFVADEGARMFKDLHLATEGGVDNHIKSWARALQNCEDYYHPNWWEGEDYYMQMIVEKVDLVTLFDPVCKKYHIPVANGRGWSSILQRADYARRFKQAEDRGLKCVLLYCGDHDPDGLRISDVLRKNIADVSGIYWTNGDGGYNPEDLEISRFGLNYDFIIKNKLTWIDNLITGSGKNLADPNHRNYKLPYLQKYLAKIGERKCEANALVTDPEAGRELCEDVILSFLGVDAEDRFKERKTQVDLEITDRQVDIGLYDAVQDAIDKLDNGSGEEQ